MTSISPTTGRPSRRVWLVTAITVAVLALGAASWYLLAQRDGPTSVASPTTPTAAPDELPEPTPTRSESPEPTCPRSSPSRRTEPSSSSTP